MVGGGGVVRVVQGGGGGGVDVGMREMVVVVVEAKGTIGAESWW